MAHITARLSPELSGARKAKIYPEFFETGAEKTETNRTVKIRAPEQ